MTGVNVVMMIVLIEETFKGSQGFIQQLAIKSIDPEHKFLNPVRLQLVHCSLSKKFSNYQLSHGMYGTHLVFGAIPKFNKQALLSH